MDETTKILIGTISGFIIAFFAEPVKMFFLTRSRKNQLQVALYSEIYNNYNVLGGFLKLYGEIDAEQSKDYFRGSIKHSIRSECYKYYISSQPDLFYQLREASQLNVVYTTLFSLLDPELRAANFEDFRYAVAAFPLLVQQSLADNKIFVNIMKKAVGKEAIYQILENQKLSQTFPNK